MEYLHEGRMNTVHTKKEVILSAGAVGSPHILLLSGVGPKEHLMDMKVRFPGKIIESHVLSLEGVH